MRKLTVKNFSVIKEAELEFGKITVLIGPQSSGKSLLCKLAFFFTQIVPESGLGTLLLRIPFREFQETIRNEFIQRFPKVTWSLREFNISYISDSDHLSVDWFDSDALPTVSFQDDIQQRYDRWIDSHLDEGSASAVVSSVRRGEWVPDLPIQPEGSIYIPTGRAFFSTPNKALFASSGKNLDWITQRFATEIDWEYRALIESPIPASDLLPQFQEDAACVLSGRVIRQDGSLLFESDLDGRKLPFQLLSSGTQELLPLLNPLAKLVQSIATDPRHLFSTSVPMMGPIFVEEPELSVFPRTQYDLVRLFSWVSGEPRLGFPFVVTTHSPYILTAFNSLIEAWRAGNMEGKHDRVVTIVPERFWVNENDFAAYTIRDGVLTPIFQIETDGVEGSGLIDGDYLDSISDEIGGQFDKLLDIEYAE
jgi:hypothetical protein